MGWRGRHPLAPARIWRPRQMLSETIDIKLNVNFLILTYHHV